MDGTTTRSPIRTRRAARAASGRRVSPARSTASLQGRTRAAARIAWLVLASLALALFVASAWIWLDQTRRSCPPQLCQHGRVPPALARALADLHLSAGFVGGYSLALNVVFTLGFAAVAGLLFWRRSADPLALFVSLALLLFGAASFGGGLLPLLGAYPGLQLPATILGFLGVAGFGAFMYVFPDGRFVPRWTRVAAAGWALWMLPNYLLQGSPLDFDTWPAVAFFGSWALFLTTIVAAQVYRYRRVSTPTQRLQTKWVVLGFAGASTGYLGSLLLLFFLARRPASAPAVLADLAGTTLVYASLLLIPVCVGIAMLRHHLFDVDVIIRTTLVYTALVVTLALLYEGGTLVLVKVLLAVSGQSAFAVEVAVAFGVGVLAGPLHHRIERDLARLLDPPKYEAELRIAAISKQIRRELGVVPAAERLEEAVAQRLERARSGVALQSSGQPKDLEGP